MPRDYSNRHDHLLVKNLNQRKILSTCEIIQNVSNENDNEEIYLDDYEIDALKNGLNGLDSEFVVAFVNLNRKLNSIFSL